MAKFTYQLIDQNGQKEKGWVEAGSRQEAAERVKKKGWFLISLKNKSQSGLNLSWLGKKDKLSAFERIIFTDHLAAMFKSGTSIVEALTTYQEEEYQKSLLFQALIKNIQQGRKLSEAMADWPESFPAYYLALIQSGELAGNLDETLEYLAEELRREYEFKEQIKSALMYPALVLAVALGVILLLVLVVIPKITEITVGFGGDLPLATRLVSKIASWLTLWGPRLAVGFLALIVAFILFLRNQKTKVKLDPYLLRLPLIGLLLKKYCLARFLRVTGSCLQYGIPFSATFAVVGEVVGNAAYRQTCEQMENKVVRGMSFSTALSQAGKHLFPGVITRTVRGAEKTGYVDQAMLRLSSFYEKAIDRELKRLTDLLEPLLVVVLGVIVAAIALAVIVPIYQMMGAIK